MWPHWITVTVLSILLGISFPLLCSLAAYEFRALWKGESDASECD